MSAHVVILGCGRSGTSIFGELFECLTPYHPRYHFEPHFDELRTIDFSAGPVAIKVPKLPPGHAMTPGLPFVLEQLLQIVPQPRVIFWQIRHPLDAICSLRPGITAGWKHNPKPADWVAWMGKPVILQCARHWQNINETGYLAVKDIATVTRYEDLVSDPRGFTQKVCGAIGLDAAAHAAEIEAWGATVGSAKSGYEAKRQVHWSRPDHTKRVERWRENLRPEELVAVRPIVEAAARLHGYRLPDTVATDGQLQ